jgi:hypothetical protein
MRKKLQIGLSALVVAAVVAVPAAQAAVPPIKAFPKFFINGKKLTTVREPAIGFGATITLENNVLGAMQCSAVAAGVTYNETTEGTEKGLENTTGFMTYKCLTAAPCKVKNTQGEEVEGIFVTAESPPIPEHGTEAHPTGISSLPWTGEAIERETSIRQILTHHLKVWAVFPPESVGKGNCPGVEVPFEEKEGRTEKEAGYELAPVVLSGTRNGLKPSGGEFQGQSGETEKGFPITGKLKSEVGPGFVSATKLINGGLKGGWELLTVE